MTDPQNEITAEDLTTYATLLGQIRDRVDKAVSLLRGGEVTVFEVEHAALQLRMVLELIVLGSLVTHRGHVAAVTARFTKKGAGDARRLVRDINPDYWPAAVQVSQAPNGDLSMTYLAEIPLPEADYGRAYGALSEMLHPRNPFGAPTDYYAAADVVLGLAARIIEQLSVHIVRPVDTSQVIVGQMEGGGGRPVATRARGGPAGPGPGGATPQSVGDSGIGSPTGQAE